MCITIANGVPVPEIDDASRTTLQAAVNDYIDHKENELGRRPSSITQYRNALDEFAKSSGVRYIDEVTEAVLRRYLRFMKEPKHGRDGRVIRRGYAPKTISPGSRFRVPRAMNRSRSVTTPTIF